MFLFLLVDLIRFKNILEYQSDDFNINNSSFRLSQSIFLLTLRQMLLILLFVRASGKKNRWKSPAELSWKITPFDQSALILLRLVNLFSWVAAFNCLFLCCIFSSLSNKLETLLSLWTPLSLLPFCFHLATYFFRATFFQMFHIFVMSTKKI